MTFAQLQLPVVVFPCACLLTLNPGCFAQEPELSSHSCQCPQVQSSMKLKLQKSRPSHFSRHFPERQQWLSAHYWYRCFPSSGKSARRLKKADSSPIQLPTPCPVGTRAAWEEDGRGEPDSQAHSLTASERFLLFLSCPQ